MLQGQIFQGTDFDNNLPNDPSPSPRQSYCEGVDRVTSFSFSPVKYYTGITSHTGHNNHVKTTFRKNSSIFSNTFYEEPFVSGKQVESTVRFTMI